MLGSDVIGELTKDLDRCNRCGDGDAGSDTADCLVLYAKFGVDLLLNRRRTDAALSISAHSCSDTLLDIFLPKDAVSVLRVVLVYGSIFI